MTSSKSATFIPLSDSDSQWLTSHLRVIPSLVALYSPADEGSAPTAAVLDRAFSGALGAGLTDLDYVNKVINVFGAAFGSLLVDAGFEWVIAADEYGTDLAVVALKGEGDVLVYPANFVSKRWERGESGFIATAVDAIVNQRDAVAAERGRKRPAWWRRG